MARPQIYKRTLTQLQKEEIRGKLGSIHVQLHDLHDLMSDAYGPSARQTTRLQYLPRTIARARSRLIEIGVI